MWNAKGLLCSGGGCNFTGCLSCAIKSLASCYGAQAPPCERSLEKGASYKIQREPRKEGSYAVQYTY